MRGHARNAPRTDALSLVQYLDLKTYLPGDILVKVDRASMAHSLEVRVPMLDYTLIDWAFGLPADVKLRGAEGKYILKKALEPYLPNDILYRKKMGFAVPVAQWFRGPLRSKVRSTLLSGPVADSAPNAAFINDPEVVSGQHSCAGQHHHDDEHSDAPGSRDPTAV